MTALQGLHSGNLSQTRYFAIALSLTDALVKFHSQSLPGISQVNHFKM